MDTLWRLLEKIIPISGKEKGAKASDADPPDKAGLTVVLHHPTRFWFLQKFSSTIIENAVQIAWGDAESYWNWFSSTEYDGTVVRVAELVNVCWLDVRGEVTSSNLSSKTMYEVFFIIMLKRDADGWQVPENIGIQFQGDEQKSKLSLMTKPRDKWIELKVGEFLASGKDNIKFFIHDHETGSWKSGLLIKGIVVRPKMASRAVRYAERVKSHFAEIVIRRFKGIALQALTTESSI